MSGVEGLEKIEGFLSTNFTKDGGVGSVAKTGFEQLADGDCGDGVTLRLASLEANNVGLANLNLGGVFDDQQAAFCRDEIRNDIEEGCFAGSCASGDQNVFTIQDSVVKKIRHFRGQGSDADEVVNGEGVSVKFANGKGDSLNAARGHDGGDAAAIGQAGIKDGFFLGDIVAKTASNILDSNFEAVVIQSDTGNVVQCAVFFDKDICWGIDHDFADIRIENEVLDLAQIGQDELESVSVRCFSSRHRLIQW